MKRSVLIVVTSDPSTSGSPAEATRIAAGLSTHERLAVTVCLCGAAAQILREDHADLVDGDHFPQYLPVLAESGTILILEDRESPGAGNPNGPRPRQIAPAEFQQLLATSDRVMRF